MTAKKKVFNISLLRRIMQFAAPYRSRFILSIVLAIVLALLSPVRPYLIQYTINNYIKPGQPGDVQEMLVKAIVLITVAQVGILLLESFFRFVFSFLTSWLGQTVVRDLRVKVYRKVLGLNLSQFDRTPIGTLTTRTINDIESINEIFSEGLIPIVADLLSIISILAFMFWTDWKLTLISLAPFPFLIMATYVFKESVNKSFIRVRNAVASLNAFVQEHITGMSIVQAFAAEDREFNKFREINKDHRNANIKAIFAYSIFFPIVEIVLAVGTGLVVWYAGTRAYGMDPGEAQLLVGKMMSFYLCLNLLFRPLRVIADKFNVLQMGMIASERVFKVMDNEDFITGQGTKAPEKSQGKVEFRDVSFAYVDEQYVLKNVNFKVE
ncbi:MAG: ABC transporter transmembrane domain-containing protein, partial [Flavitalea sp.]